MLQHNYDIKKLWEHQVKNTKKSLFGDFRSNVLQKAGQLRQFPQTPFHVLSSFLHLYSNLKKQVFSPPYLPLPF